MSDQFFWGVANSAFQVEGSPLASDWKTWTETPGKILDHTNAEKVTHFWESFAEDFQLARDLGCNSFRISLAWERIQPEKGKFDQTAIDNYLQMIQSMKKLGLEPIVTLHHFVLPDWLAREGGVLSPEFPELFKEFAVRTVRELSGHDLVRYWITFNEPNVLIRSGFMEGEWPPGKKNDFESAGLAAFRLSQAHCEAVKAIREDPRTPSSGLQFGMAIHWRVFQPKQNRWLDRMACKLVDWAFNQQIVNSVRSGKIKSWFPGARLRHVHLNYFNEHAGLDFIGLNYYGRSIVEATLTPPFVVVEEGKEGARTDMDWEIYPEGMLIALEEIHRHYGLPILITENGIADAKDEKRSGFIRKHVAAVMSARKKGIPVFGYLYWSLTDNFEWAHGLKPRFGLVAVDYETMTKTPRDSYQVYRDLIREHVK